MNQLENLSPEDRTEVVRIAARLRDEDQQRAAEAQERTAFESAAAEMEISPEYLERAAQQLQQTRIVQAQGRRRTRRAVYAAVAAVAAAAGLWIVTHRPPPPPNVYSFNPQQWALTCNPESHASVSFGTIDGKNAADIHVQSFAPRASDGQYFVNMDAAPTVSSFSGYNTASFFVEGQGLKTVRLYLEGGPGERWRSPPIQIGAGWARSSIPLNQFDHQVKESPQAPWQTTPGYVQPDHLKDLSFKVGQFMNDAGASGDAAIADLEFN